DARQRGGQVGGAGLLQHLRRDHVDRRQRAADGAVAGTGAGDDHRLQLLGLGVRGGVAADVVLGGGGRAGERQQHGGGQRGRKQGAVRLVHGVSPEKWLVRRNNRRLMLRSLFVNSRIDVQMKQLAYVRVRRIGGADFP